MTYKVAILGASGYTGAELVRLLAGHPEFEIAALSADRKAGQPYATVFPQFRHLNLPDLVSVDDIDAGSVDLVFAALPHGLSQAIVKGLPPATRVIDLGADFRLRDPADYEKWYGRPHDAPEVQPQAVYGLTEFYRDEIRQARLVAGTGCNAATVQYALRPVISEGLIDLDDIICDLKNGPSGAGRSLKEHMLFTERSTDVMGYSLGGTHRHLGEFDQEFGLLAGRPVEIRFAPHLVPVNRGILATSFVKGQAENIHACLEQAYENEPFIQMLPFGEVPGFGHVAGSNYVHIGVVGDRIAGRATIVAALDNLCKGSSGQAVQNANVMFGIEESTGLTAPAVFP